MRDRWRLSVKGDADAVNSFAACVCASARYFGIQVEYEWIAGLAGTCFSPCHNRGEDCIGWKIDGGSPARMDIIMRVLGMNWHRIDRKEGVPDAWEEEYQQRRNLTE